MRRWIWKIRKNRKTGEWRVWRTNGITSSRKVTRHTWHGCLAYIESESLSGREIVARITEGY